MKSETHTLTWLHLSDLHYCDPRTGWDAGTVLGTLLDDVRKMEDRFGSPPDLIFFTGDLAFGSVEDGLESQYKGVGAFLDSIRNAFSREVPKDHMFLVPGNHDVDRNAVSEMETMWLDMTHDEGKISDMIKTAGREWENCFRRMHPYRDFLDANGYDHLLADPQRLVYAVDRKIGGKTIGIGGFNSAWSCSRESAKERGQLWMGANWQSRTIHSKIKNADVKIALAHHPEDWFKAPEKQYFIRIREGFQFFLHGHEHTEWVTPIANSHATVSAGACYDPSDIGYNFVRIDFDEDTVEVWPREYSKKGPGGWTRAQIPGKLDDDGAWRIRGFQWGNTQSASVKKIPSSPKKQPTPANPLRKAWLNQVLEETGFVSLAGVDRRSAAGSDMMRVDLDSVYTALLTHSAEAEERWLEKRVRPEDEKRLSALDMLNRHNRLVLLGEPGSGKSTFVNFVAWCLAGENLGSSVAHLNLLRQPLPSEKEKEENPPQPWDHPPLIPVRVILRDFVASGVLDDAEKTKEELALWLFIESAMKQKGIGDYASGLRAELMDKGGMILLDGLDEVPEANRRREMVKDAVETFARTFHRCRYLVTSRTYAYQKQNWHLNRFDVTVLSPFNLRQIRYFVDLWYRRVAPEKGMGTEAASTQAELLQREIGKNERLRDLAERPLLLTLMACLHAWHSGLLPEKREELYSETVDLLLNWWEQGKWVTGKDGQTRLWQPSIIEYLNSDRGKLRSLLERLAFDAHQGQKSLVGVADIAEDDLLAGMLKLSRNPDVKPRALVNYLSDRAGILVPRGVNVFTFPHRTFQEYLAACCQTGKGFPDDLAALFKADPDRWREVVLLAGAKQARGGPLGVWALAEALCLKECRPDSDTCDLWGAHIAGKMLIESADLTDVSQRDQPKLECVRNSLVRIVECSSLPALERAGAGVTLAKIGDPRAEVISLDAMQFCLVPPGEFVMSQNDQKEICGILDMPYWMGRFPVTNAQFEFFVRAGGYANKEYWEEAVREGVWKDGIIKVSWENEPRTRPYNYGNPFALQNHPVVGVNWYEAIAFTRWLTETWHETGVLPKERIVALPSEAEWEKAARGGIAIPETEIVLPISEVSASVRNVQLRKNPNRTRRYPYGNEPDAERMNIKKTDINTSSAVGCFSAGKSPNGCEEICGNVWEWMRSLFDNNPRILGDEMEDLRKITDSTWISIRGGAWTYGADSRCGFRDGFSPHFQGRDLGFRLLLRAPFSTSGL